MATSVHAHSADLERDCQNAWGCVQNTTSDRISSAEELRYGELCNGRCLFVTVTFNELICTPNKNYHYIIVIEHCFATKLSICIAWKDNHMLTYLWQILHLQMAEIRHCTYVHAVGLPDKSAVSLSMRPYTASSKLHRELHIAVYLCNLTATSL